MSAATSVSRLRVSLLFVLLLTNLATSRAIANEKNSGSDGERVRRRDPKAPPQSEDPDLPAIAKHIDKDLYLRKRAEYIMLRRGLPFPPGSRDPRAVAIRQLEAQELRRYGLPARAQFQPADRKPVLNSTSWSPIGPAPLPNGQTYGTSVPVSGRVTSIAVHPTNPNIVYVGTPDGGLYRSLDGGSSWTSLMDGALTLSIGSIAIDPLNPSTVLVGTGDIEGADFGGVGVYMITSADGLAPVLSGPFNLDTSGTDVLTGNCITRVLISPTDDNIVFVSTTYASQSAVADHFPASPPSRGLFRSTNFMSASPTFTKLPVTTANSGNRRVTDMVFDPGNANDLILNVGGFANVNNVPDGGLYRVTNALTTPVYTQTLNIDGLMNAKFAVNKTGSVVTILAATEEANGCTGAGGVLRRSTDGGQTWSAPLPATAIFGFCGSQCGYDLAVAVDPTNANNILLGGSFDDTTSPSCRASTQLLSTDGASTFNRADAQLHADTHAIVFAPSNPLILYAGNDGGIFKSTDGGPTWSSLNNSGFSATQFQSFSAHPLDRNFSLGGTQDNGTPMMQTNAAWTRADFGDGASALIDRNAGDTYPLLMYHTYYDITNSLIALARVDNVADAHDYGWALLGYGGWANGLGNDASVLFFAPMALGAGNPNALYFGTDRLYRSADSGITMSVVSQAPLVSGQAISTIAVSPQDDTVRVVALQNGRVFATTTGSTTMTEITGSLPAYFPSRVMIDPNNRNTAYVALSGYGLAAGQHVWKNSNLANGGANWVASGNGIPDVPVDTIVVDPSNSNDLYAGTDIGVYASTDAGTSWAPFGTGLPRVAVFDLAIQSPSRVLRAATYGRGVWEISIPGSAYPALSISTVTASPISGNGNAYIELGESASITIQVTNHGVVTATGVTVTISSSSAGVTLGNATSAFADIAAGGSATNSVPLTFDVAQSAACGGVLNFVITLSASGAPSVTQPFRVVLGGPASSPMTFTHAGTAMRIPDNQINGVLVPLAVSGVTGPIDKVTLIIGGSSCNATAGSTTVGIDHTWVSDLQITLISPSGTAVRLSLNSGGGGINFCNTDFDDSAATAFSSVTASQNPFSGTFRPYAPLSTFAGESANGTWQLKVVDTYPGNTGNVRAFSITITPAACAAVLAAPQNLQAQGASTSSVNVTWSAVTGADHYEVYRSSNAAAYALVASPASNAFSDSGLAAATTYLYKVRAVSTTIGTSEFSSIDPATTIVFTDDPLVAGVTVVKAVHVTELRQAVNAMRASVGLAPATFTDPTLTSSTIIRAVHISELRTALSAARTALGLTVAWTDNPLVAGTTVVKAVHLQEIRNGTQ